VSRPKINSALILVGTRNGVGAIRRSVIKSSQPDMIARVINPNIDRVTY
jgi:hypothetical protein